MIKNRLTELFKKKNKNILSVYFTAGYPALNDTLKIARELEASGVDFIEIGFPFSDPLADGPVIQKSSEVSLENGMSLVLLFEQLKELRKHLTIPVVLMGYVNPVISYGIENFCRKCAEVGVDATIIPDLPMYEYESMYRSVFEENNISNIFLVTPQSSEERIRKIDGLSSGFIYVLSSSSTTGKELKQEGSDTYFERLKSMNLENPLMIGFGISKKEHIDHANKYAAGVIVGSAFVKTLSEGTSVEQFIGSLVH